MTTIDLLMNAAPTILTALTAVVTLVGILFLVGVQVMRWEKYIEDGAENCEKGARVVKSCVWFAAFLFVVWFVGTVFVG